jgi:hypothetical protein
MIRPTSGGMMGHHITARWPNAVAVLRSDSPGRLPAAFSVPAAILSCSVTWRRRAMLLISAAAAKCAPISADRLPRTGGEHQIVAAIKAGADDYVTRTTQPMPA